MYWSLLVLILGLIVVFVGGGVVVSKLQNFGNTRLDSSTQDSSQSLCSRKNQSVKQQKKFHKERSTPKARFGNFFGELQQRTHCVAVLRCHTEQVTCFAFHPTKRCLISCSSDRSVRLWWDPVDKHAKFSSVNLFTLAASKDKVKFPDSAEACCWSRDGQNVLFALNHTRAIRSYYVSENQKLVAGDLDVISPHKHTIKDIEVDPYFRYFVTYDNSSIFVVWSMRGNILATVDTHQVQNNQIKISPDGLFIASAGFIGDVYLWEMLFQKNSREFLGLNKVIDLKAHQAGVKGIAFSCDNKVATICKDRTIRVWNIDVRYKLGEDAKLLFSLEPWASEIDLLLHVTFTPNGKFLVVAGNDSVAFYSLEMRQVVAILQDCTGQGRIDIKRLSFSGDGTLLATLGQGQQWISLWNIPVMPSFSSVAQL